MITPVVSRSDSPIAVTVQRRKTAVTQGGLYYWQDEREVPDQWNVAFDYPKKKMGVTFNCTFNNVHVGEMAQYLGRDGTLDGFEALVPGAVVYVTPGEQGLQHIVLGFRGRGFDPTGPLVDRRGGAPEHPRTVGRR